jgi:uroporphyrinogen decarboxylase
MTKRERLQAAVEGRSGDRVPVGFWYHFPLEHPSGEELAEAELAFAKKYDPDFLKVMHDLPFDLPDGMTSVERPEDWLKIRPVDPRTGSFADQLSALKAIKKGLDDDMPVIDTIFDPYATANKLCGKKIMEHLHANSEAVRHGLQVIAITLANYAAAWIAEGGDGIFYALDGAEESVTTREEYAEVFLPFDRMILESAMEKGTFNVLHIHGTGIFFDLVHALPAHVLNWSSKTTAPSLTEARGLHSGCIAGGIDETTILEKSALEVMNEGKQAIAEAGEDGFILACGCAIPTETPEESIFAIRATVLD